ncbi:PotD/PotF family extracellular solute-binding protein [Natrarchaeobius sp. A-rgal3]|uniref:ABC transporter substrate-binding protein n=1 Tax=Natrarchaeobius versutus TaxID=1679078 RepID=UPI00350FB1B8
MGLTAGCLSGNGDDEYVRPIEVDEIPPAEHEGEVNNWNFFNEWMGPLAEPFEEEYGITVHNNFITSPVEVDSELQAGNEEIDTVLISEPTVSTGIEEGWWEPLPVEIMDAWDTLPDRFREEAEEHYTQDGETYMMSAIEQMETVLVYNTDYFDSPPDSWDILWQDDLADDIAMMDGFEFNCYAAALYTGQNPRNPDDFEEIEEVLEQQRDLNRTYWSDYSEGQAMMSREDIVVTVNTGGRAYNSHFDDGAPVDWTIPEEGCTISDSPHAIPTGAPHPRAALTWYDYFMTGQAAVQLFLGHGEVPSIADWEEQASEAGIPQDEIDFMDREAKNRHDAPLYSPQDGFSQETMDRYVEIWDRIRAGG